MSIEKLISDFVSQAEEIQLSILVQRALTLSGRIPEEDKLSSLTLAEHYAVECISNGDYNFSSDGNMGLAFRPHGRLYILPKEDLDTHSQFFTLLGYFNLAEGELCTYRSMKELERSSLEQERTTVLNYLLPYEIERVCREIVTLSNHMAPLIYYVGEYTISNFYEVGKSGCKLESTLEHALNTVIEQQENAPIEFLMIVFGMHLLLRSGGYTRLEELNSTQFSFVGFEQFFESKYEIYKKVLDSKSPISSESSFYSSSLGEKAELLAEMRKVLQSTGSRFIREIGGANLRKKEDILPTSQIETNVSTVSGEPSELTKTLLKDWLILEHPSFKEAPIGCFEELLKKLIMPQDGSFSFPLESLIDYVVSEAVYKTHSDFGMTRGTRDFLKLSKALSQDETTLACDWGQAEYFCHVVPHEKMRAVHSPKMLLMMLNAISGRMRFNTWHYAPSYFAIENIPAKRDWFYAPRMADTADHSDQHHTGHIHATVRYSIRSPLPIYIKETILPGFIDLRLMRQSGKAYSRENLITAIAYTESLQFIYQNLMNLVLKENKNFVFTFGSKDWIQQNYSLQKLEVADAAN